MQNRLILGINAVNRGIGEAVSWLTLAMVLFTFAIVVLRYAFGIGPIWLQESVTWMHAAIFMLGGAYALQRDEHVRVDIFYRGMTTARRAWVDCLGVLLFLFPLCAFIIYESWDYVGASWSIRESSREAGGLPFPLFPLLKTILIVMPTLVALQGLSLLLTSLQHLRNAEPDGSTPEPGR